MVKNVVLLLALVLLSCADKKDLTPIGISCDYEVSEVVDRYVGFEENGFSYYIYNLDSNCDSFVKEGYPILEGTKIKSKWFIETWSDENSLYENSIKHNIYFNHSLSFKDRVKVNEQLERHDMLWSGYFEGSKFPLLENEDLTLGKFEIYAFDSISKKIHRFSSW